MNYESFLKTNYSVEARILNARNLKEDQIISFGSGQISDQEKNL